MRKHLSVYSQKRIGTPLIGINCEIIMKVFQSGIGAIRRLCEWAEYEIPRVKFNVVLDCLRKHGHTVNYPTISQQGLPIWSGSFELPRTRPDQCIFEEIGYEMVYIRWTSGIGFPFP